MWILFHRSSYCVSQILFKKNKKHCFILVATVMWMTPWISDQQTVIQQNLASAGLRFILISFFFSYSVPFCQVLTLWNVKSQALLTMATRSRMMAILPTRLCCTAVILVTHCMAAAHWRAWAETDVFGTNHCRRASVRSLQHLIMCGGGKQAWIVLLHFISRNL